MYAIVKKVPFLKLSSFDYYSTLHQTEIKFVSTDDDYINSPTVWMFLNIKKLNSLSLKQTKAECIQMSTLSGLIQQGISSDDLIKSI